MLEKKEKKQIKKSDKSENTVGRFSFAMPILKCFEEVTRDKNGEEKKKRFIEGSASSTDIDLHGDQMAPSAIKSMADSIKKHIISLNAEHDKSWQSELGEVSKLSVDKKNRLIMKAGLDETSKANDLWYALTEKKKELGLSIGGFVKDYKLEWDKKKETFKRIFKDIELDHIAVTSTPANPKTWVGAISKSIDKAERNINFESLDDMPKEALVKFIEKSLEKVVGEDNLKKLLTNFSLNFNEETIMSIKKKESSLESEEAKKVSTKSKNDEAKKDASELEDEEEIDEQESENPENEEDKDTAEEAEGTSEEEDDDKNDEDEEEVTEEEEKETEEEETEEEAEEEKSVTREEVASMVEKGVAEGLKGFFSKLLGKSEDDEDGDEDKATEKSKGETKDEAVDLLKSIVSRQDKLEKMLKKKSINRKTVNSVAIDKNEEESNKEEGVYKSLDDELVAVKKQFANDPERAFAECGKVRRKWAEQE